MPGKVFSAFAAPDDEIPIILNRHIEILSNKSGHLHAFDKVLACTWIWPLEAESA